MQLRIVLLLIATTVPGAVVGLIAYLYSRRLAPTRVRRMLRSIGLAAAISPFGVYLGPEAEFFFPFPATAVFAFSVVATLFGKSRNLMEPNFGSVLAIVLASIALFAAFSAWGALRGRKRSRLYRTCMVVGVIPFLVFYFVKFEVYRAQANYGFYSVGENGWEVRAFAVAVSQHKRRLAFCRFLTDHDYGLGLWMKWTGKGPVPDEPKLISAELISGGVRTPLAVAKSVKGSPWELHDGRIHVARHTDLAASECTEDDRPCVTIDWWHRQVEVVLSYESKSTQELMIPLRRKERLVPHYAPLFAFAMRHPFRNMFGSGPRTEPPDTSFQRALIRSGFGQLNSDR